MQTTDNYKDYMTSHEFFELVWDRIPEELVSNKYMDENIDYLRDITFEFYSLYREDKIPLNLSAKLITTFFEKTFKYKPLLCNIVDDYMVNSED